MMMGLMLLFWVGIIAAGIAVMRYLFDEPRPQAVQSVKRKRSPLAARQERYTRGELSRDEYHAILNDITKQQEDTDGY